MLRVLQAVEETENVKKKKYHKKKVFFSTRCTMPISSMPFTSTMPPHPPPHYISSNHQSVFHELSARQDLTRRNLSELSSNGGGLGISESDLFGKPIVRHNLMSEVVSNNQNGQNEISPPTVETPQKNKAFGSEVLNQSLNGFSNGISNRVSNGILNNNGHFTGRKQALNLNTVFGKHKRIRLEKPENTGFYEPDVESNCTLNQPSFQINPKIHISQINQQINHHRGTLQNITSQNSAISESHNPYNVTNQFNQEIATTALPQVDNTNVADNHIVHSQIDNSVSSQTITNLQPSQNNTNFPLLQPLQDLKYQLNQQAAYQQASNHQNNPQNNAHSSVHIQSTKTDNSHEISKNYDENSHISNILPHNSQNQIIGLPSNTTIPSNHPPPLPSACKQTLSTIPHSSQLPKIIQPIIPQTNNSEQQNQNPLLGANNLRIIEKLDTTELLSELSGNKEFQAHLCHIKEIGEIVLHGIGGNKKVLSPANTKKHPKVDSTKGSSTENSQNRDDSESQNQQDCRSKPQLDEFRLAEADYCYVKMALDSPNGEKREGQQEFTNCIPLWYPFFVLDQGWTSIAPKLTQQLCNLSCCLLKGGDKVVIIKRKSSRQKMKKNHGNSDSTVNGAAVQPNEVVQNRVQNSAQDSFKSRLQKHANPVVLDSNNVSECHPGVTTPIKEMKNGATMEITPNGLKMILNQQLLVNEIKGADGQSYYSYIFNLFAPKLGVFENSREKRRIIFLPFQKYISKSDCTT